MLQLQNVSKLYSQGHSALDHITFTLEQGEMAFLTGHSGAGKTSLLKLVALIEACTEGAIKVAGQDVGRLPRRKALLLRRSMGIIFQQPYLLMDQDVFHNVALPLFIAGQSRKSSIKPVQAVLEQTGLPGYDKVMAGDLSAGELQRLSIARAIVTRPRLLLADEPTGNLDPALALEIMSLFQKLNHEGMSVLVASHDLALIARLKHRVITLSKGRLVNDGKGE